MSLGLAFAIHKARTWEQWGLFSSAIQSTLSTRVSKVCLQSLVGYETQTKRRVLERGNNHQYPSSTPAHFVLIQAVLTRKFGRLSSTMTTARPISTQTLRQSRSTTASLPWRLLLALPLPSRLSASQLKSTTSSPASSPLRYTGESAIQPYQPPTRSPKRTPFL